MYFTSSFIFLYFFLVFVLHLIMLFSCISCYLIFLGINFIGLSYLLVYVGAVSILFLFILMHLNYYNCSGNPLGISNNCDRLPYHAPVFSINTFVFSFRFFFIYHTIRLTLGVCIYIFCNILFINWLPFIYIPVSTCVSYIVFNYLQGNNIEKKSLLNRFFFAFLIVCIIQLFLSSFFIGLIYICVPDHLVSAFNAFICQLVKKDSIISMFPDFSKDLPGLRYKDAPNLNPMVKPDCVFSPGDKGLAKPIPEFKYISPNTLLGINNLSDCSTLVPKNK